MARQERRSESSERSEPDRLTAGQAAKAGLAQLLELIGRKPLGVASVEPAEGGWVIGVEVVEETRIPSSADMLALYEAEIDDDGALVSYRRLRRYPRGRGDDREGR